MRSPERPSRLRAFLIGIRTPDLQATRVVDHVRRRLNALVPNAEFVILDSPERTRRDAILGALAEWKKGAEPGVPHLFYYFGHGGRAIFADIPEGGDRVVHYLTCAPEPGGRNRALFSSELSHHLGELHDACGNVTAILDSCYAGSFRREQPAVGRPEVWRFEQTPDWAREVLHSICDPTLAAEGHPEVVRLMAASPRREAMAMDLLVRGELVRGIGLFTNLWLRQLEELGDDWWRTSWEMLAHAIRQRVISKSGNESQWIAVAGPQRRLLLSTEQATRASAVGTAPFDGTYWIRAGGLTGVQEGDEWALVSPFVDSELEHPPLVRTKVEEIGSNLTRLAPIELPDRGPDPVAAVLIGVARRMPVFVEGSDELCRKLSSTTWLEVGDGRHGLRVSENEILVVDREREWGIVRFRTSDEGQRGALELLEDRARVARLLTHATSLPESPKRSPIEWSVGIERDRVAANTELAPCSALWIHLCNTDPESGNWFSSVVLIDAIGRPFLLNSSQFDGVELEPGTDDYVGRRLGAARRGVVLDWPDGIVERGSGRLRLVVLVSKRPIQLGHLAQLQPSSGFEAMRMQGFQLPRAKPGEKVYRTAVRISKIESPSLRMTSSDGWAAETFDLLLRAP